MRATRRGQRTSSSGQGQMSRELMLHDPPSTPPPPPCAPPPTPESYVAKAPAPSPFSVSRRRKLRREARALEARRTVLEQSIATAQADLKHVTVSLTTILGRLSECAKPSVRLGQDLVMDVVPMGLDDVVARKIQRFQFGQVSLVKFPVFNDAFKTFSFERVAR